MYLAKPNKTIKMHTEETLEAFDELLNLYGEYFAKEDKELISIAIKYHDYGKANQKFQEKIRKHIKVDGEIYHNFLSPYFLNGIKEKLIAEYGEEKGKFYYNIICTSIYYHHNRPENFTDKNIIEYVEKYIINFLPKDSIYKADIKNFNRHKNLLFTNKSFKRNAKSEDIYIKYALVKGVLNHCDYASSSGQVPEIKTDEKGYYLYENIHNKFGNKLTEAQKFMEKNQDKNVVLIAPTGAGKTEASLLWLAKNKGFYILPLKVASNAIYERIYNNYNYQEVSLLHSDAIEELSKNKSLEDSYLVYKEARLFAYPLTICTVDQIFKFPFKALGTEIMLATLSYSKVIIDEIQMYSSTILAAIIVGLGMLVKAGGKFAITTATIPHFFLSFLNRKVNVDSYVYKEFLDTELNSRHKIKLIDNDFNYEKIIATAKTKKVLIICNTVKKAVKVYQDILARDNSVLNGLLHSRFIKNDRQKKEDKILNEQNNGIWVTTQIVEASLDIDFDELHTEMVPVDSLFQRFGRCYRKRNYDGDIANIYIYNNENGKNKIYDADVYDRSWHFIQTYDNKIMSEQDKMKLMNQVYNEAEIKNTKYYKDIETKINKIEHIYLDEYDKEEVQNLFREIYNITIIPDGIYEENIDFINKCVEIISSKKSPGLEKIKAEYALYKYTVSIPRYLAKDVTRIRNLDIYRSRGNYDTEIGFTEYEGGFNVI